MTDRYTASETVSATDSDIALFSGKTDGSTVENSDIPADSVLSMENFCDTTSIFCTSDFLEIPLGDAELSLSNNPAMLKQVSNICKKLFDL